ncbi:hypothetical protein WUBG_01548 [Wuchereria bancrofti]|uniref:Uncharacterized protein n=1 Tax=Wuchereria bancrofti TaxID=6293 RepID=J9BJI0_WUCBA|nr:hypothetical protein WUBG_01548 [Wuchereria bancrofti]VDM11248.1 unnamed protein product [Wuchereria bancrofti]
MGTPSAYQEYLKMGASLREQHSVENSVLLTQMKRIIHEINANDRFNNERNWVIARASDDYLVMRIQTKI